MNHAENWPTDLDVDEGMVRKALNRLDSPEELGRLPLALSAMVEERLQQMRLPRLRLADRGYVLASIIKATIEATFPSDKQPPDSEQSEPVLMGRSLTLRYIDRKSREEAAHELGLGRALSTYDRLNTKAVQKLTAELRLINHEAAKHRAGLNHIEEKIRLLKLAFDKERYEEVIDLFRHGAPVFYDLGFWQDYLDMSRKAVHGAEHTGQEDLAAEIRLRDITRIYIDLKKIDEAEAEATLALAVAERRGMCNVQGEAYCTLGTVKRERKDYAGSIEDLKKSQAAFQAGQDPLRCLQIGGIRAVALRRWGNWQEAEEELLDLLVRYSEIEDPKDRDIGEAMTRCRLGTLYYERAITKYAEDPQKRQEDLARARAQYEQALELEKKHSRSRSVAFNNKKLALVEMAAGNPDKAGKLLQEAGGFFGVRGYPGEVGEIKDLEREINKCRSYSTAIAK